MLVTVDTGGTKTLVASFSEDGVLGEQFRFETPHNEHEYLSLLHKTISSHYKTDDIDALVIALPGRIDGAGKLIDAPNLGWENIDLRSELSAFYDCPILIENDANLAGLAEARQLSPTPPTCLYITISTGIGTGIITNGHIDPAYEQSEGGRMLISHDGASMPWQDFASGQAIFKTYGQYAHDITDQTVWRQIAINISVGLIPLIKHINPDIVIIGGSIGTYFDHYNTQLIKEVKNQIPNNMPAIVIAQHPEQAVIYGCYYYALDSLTTSEA